MSRFPRPIFMGVFLLACLFLVSCASAGPGIQAYMGDTIPLRGYSPSSPQVYLFLTGPNLPVNGVALNDITRPSDQGGFTVVDVNGEDDSGATTGPLPGSTGASMQGPIRSGLSTARTTVRTCRTPNTAPSPSPSATLPSPLLRRLRRPCPGPLLSVRSRTMLLLSSTASTGERPRSPWTISIREPIRSTSRNSGTPSLLQQRTFNPVSARRLPPRSLPRWDR